MAERDQAAVDAAASHWRETSVHELRIRAIEEFLQKEFGFKPWRPETLLRCKRKKCQGKKGCQCL